VARVPTPERHPPTGRRSRLRRVLGARAYYRRFPAWHRSEVGGLWEEVGELQARFLTDQGLRPEHQFLDVGCGALRAGIHLIRHLEPGHYHGIDASAELLAAGEVELERNGILDRRPTLICDPHFGVEAFDRTFDYALAHSVFTHLPINSILVCLQKIAPVLRRPGGRFFATFFENPRGTKQLGAIEHPTSAGDPMVTYTDADPYHYGLDLFEWLCEGTGLRVDYLGEWGHPRSQRMLVFEPTGDAK
jgi:SAM-dependent methyltransferase